MEFPNTMRHKPSAATRKKIAKLVDLTDDLYAGKHYQIVRLTVLKSLCADPDIARQFVLYLAERAQNELESQPGAAIPGTMLAKCRQRVQEAIEVMAQAVAEPPGPAVTEPLRKAFTALKALQNHYEQHRWGPVRIVTSMPTLVVENAVECMLNPHTCGQLAYYTARNYAERYNPCYGTGLIPESAPLMADICNFWIEFYGLALPGGHSH